MVVFYQFKRPNTLELISSKPLNNHKWRKQSSMSVLREKSKIGTKANEYFPVSWAWQRGWSKADIFLTPIRLVPTLMLNHLLLAKKKFNNLTSINTYGKYLLSKQPPFILSINQYLMLPVQSSSKFSVVLNNTYKKLCTLYLLRRLCQTNILFIRELNKHTKILL